MYASFWQLKLTSGLASATQSAMSRRCCMCVCVCACMSVCVCYAVYMLVYAFITIDHLIPPPAGEGLSDVISIHD